MKLTRCFAILALFSSVVGCSEDASEPDTRPNEVVKSISVEDFGKDPMSFYSFDLHPTFATATVLGLGMDARIKYDGSVSLRKSESVNGNPSKWTYEIAHAAVGREELTPLPPVSRIQRTDDTLKLMGIGGFETRWQHRPEGLEHYLDIASRPLGSGPLRVQMPVSDGFKHKLTDEGEVTVEYAGEYLFRWKKLLVYDAGDNVLPAHFAVTPIGIEYVIDDSQALYPIRIDPLIATPSWVVVGTGAGSRFGYSIAGVQDVNGDNFDDVVVGQSRYANGEQNEGRILLYPGSANGLPATASWTYESNQAFIELGASVDLAKDVNGDGNPDVIAGAAGEANGGLLLAGAAYLFLGTGSGVGLPTTPSSKVFGDAPDTFLGFKVAGVGDVNCDGYDDVVAASSIFGGGNGRVWVYYGAMAGIGPNPDVTLSGSSLASFGSSITGGNFNGDSNGGNECFDLVVGEPGYDQPSYTNAGRIHVYHGSAAGLPTTATATWFPQENQVRAGLSVDAGGDTNGDGYDDLVVGAPRRQNMSGQEVGGWFVFEGSASGLNAIPDVDLRTTSVGSEAGHAVAIAEDLNDDGYGDLLIGAPKYSNGQVDEGIMLEFQGSPNGIVTDPAFIDEENIASAEIGWAVGYAGDVNGDGIGDAVGTARNYNGIGAVFGYLGTRNCYINGFFFRNGDVNPGATCQVCDTSQSTTAWSTLADGSSCDDGSLCTNNDICTAGVCGSTDVVTCNDGNQCTVDTCDPATGLCDFDGTAAEGNTCTIPNQPSCQTNTCQSSTCTVSAIAGCVIGGTCYGNGDPNPANPCEVCNSALSQSAWSNAAVGTSCDDGAFCTVNDSCDGAGACNGGTARDCSSAASECYTSTACNEFSDTCIPTVPVADGTACGGDACTVAGMCQGGTCSGMTLDCSNLDTACMVGVCNPGNGLCEAQARPDGTTCDDMDACTETTTCTAGTCGGGSAVVCNDDNTCTVDTCDTATGCVFTAEPDNTACDDGTVCTENDTCTGGTCSGTAIVCDDNNECTADTCDDALGCQFGNEADGTMCIGDGLSCTTGTCQSGACDNSLNADSCLIDSTCYASGVANPASSCEVCEPGTATDAFSPAAAGSACDLAQCNADGTAVLQGACDNNGVCTTDQGAERDCDAYFCVDGACQVSCSNDDGCRDGFICENAQCVDAECATDMDCQNGEVCNDGRCDAQCTTDDDCADGETCNNGVCEEPGADCTTDDDCADGETCNNGTCEASTECQSDDDCPEGETCNDDNVCEGESTQCSVDADCADGESCQNGVCATVPKGDLEGSGCGCASSGTPQDADASWILLAIVGLVGLIRRRRA